MKWQWIAEYHGMIVIVQRASLLINGISLFIWDITRYKTRYRGTETDEVWRIQGFERRGFYLWKYDGNNTNNQLVIKWYINRSKIGIVLFVPSKISYRISIKTTIYSMKCTLYVFLKHERV